MAGVRCLAWEVYNIYTHTITHTEWSTYDNNRTCQCNETSYLDSITCMENRQRMSFTSDILRGKREIHSINAAKDHENEHDYIFLISLIEKEKKNLLS